MKLTPKGGNSPIPTAPAEKQSISLGNRGSDKVQKAIAAFNKGLQQHPVQDPSRVTPEEMSVVRPPSVQTPNSDSDLPSADPVSIPAEETLVEKKQATTEDPLSTQYAMLARKEKALRAKVQAQEAASRAKEQAIIAREEALKAKEAEYQTNYIPKSRLKADALAVLTEEGISYDQITQAILNPIQQDPRILAEIEKLKAEVQESRNQQESNRKAYEDQQRQSYQQALNQIRNDTRQLVQTDPAYETIKETGSVNDVVELIEKTFNSDGVLLSVEDAAREVEEYLVEEAIKLTRIGKIKSKLAQSSKTTQQQQQVSKQQQSSPQPMKTLTNAVSSSKPMTAKERAIAAFKGQLK